MIVYRLGHQHGNHGSQSLALAIEVIAGNGVQLWLGCARFQQLKEDSKLVKPTSSCFRRSVESGLNTQIFVFWAREKNPLVLREKTI